MSKILNKTTLPLSRCVAWRPITALSLASLFALVTVGLAGVPQPDAIFYGTVEVNGQIISAADDVTVIGRVSGVPQPVGRYRMVEGTTAGDNYVLRVRLEDRWPVARRVPTQLD